jgi:hypothetical protein
MLTWEVLLEGPPVIFAVDFNKRFELLILSTTPAVLGLVGESSVPAVAHLRVSVRHESSNFLKLGVLIHAELEE